MIKKIVIKYELYSRDNNIGILLKFIEICKGVLN